MEEHALGEFFLVTDVKDLLAARQPSEQRVREVTSTKENGMRTFTSEEAAQIVEAEVAKLKSAIETSKVNAPDPLATAMFEAQLAEAEILALKFRQM